MTPERWLHIQTLFTEAIDTPPARRTQWLREACEGDDDLRRYVESLLLAGQEADGFLEHAIQEAAEGLVHQRIGPYQLVRALGRGGMGSVFLAVRADDEYQSQVAIKLIRTGLDSPDLRARFRSERQILANLDHPNIARLLDGGTTESGTPYVVMEFVDGEAILEYCDRRRLSTTERLKLFRKVCAAVECAHQNLVVHRDIKPGNIMITADGRAKIADFGIAKFTDAEATRTTTVLGTPAYMAPEQLRGGNIDARSDIFSLGAMFYWIITGQKPFPGEDLTSVSFKVVYTDPPKPTEIVPDLPRDLDTVASRCLAKNPGDRYQNAKELANDLAAIRAGKPIATTAAPKSGDDPTVSTMQVSVAAAVSKAAAALAQPMKVAPARPPRTGFVLAGVATALVVVVAYFLWPQERVVYVPFTMPAQTAQPPAKTAKSPQSKASTPQAAKGSSASPSAAADSAAADSIPVSSAEVRRAAAAKATFEVECNFSFAAATLQVFFGSQKLVDAKLEGKFRMFRSRGGTYRTSGQVPAGPHQVRVRVASDDAKEPFAQEAVIEGTFAAAAAQKLIVEFPKKQLTLRWAAVKK